MARIEALPPVRASLDALGVGARKALGQNFLFDLNLTRRIARAAAPLDAGPVIEVGPGPGGLTRALLLEGATDVRAIERDERFAPLLRDVTDASGGALWVIFEDAQAVDFAALSGGGTAQIVANLPYNVGTPLLVSWLMSEPWPPWFHRLTLMFQKEVAQRITAQVGDAHYGRLAVLANWRCTTTRLFDVPPTAFVPPPKVTSSVVQLTPRQDPLACDARALERVTAAAFGQRRKMVRQSLKGLGMGPEGLAGLLAGAGLEGTERAETLPVETFVTLARLFRAATS
ncbi:MAG: 16S rRNA (adenine(1518)-N(6)/adenine(1519)-N(6))-dimethyltransferase RsmA [Devosiaceae bacterium]|nr:16S rRNA (adenine(1518)-N(6)/adenine(1519)-N(6))-dimethyltransferase RsmA [Devosiaceae bacterium MH13]